MRFNINIFRPPAAACRDFLTSMFTGMEIKFNFCITYYKNPLGYILNINVINAQKPFISFKESPEIYFRILYTVQVTCVVYIIFKDSIDSLNNNDN